MDTMLEKLRLVLSQGDNNSAPRIVGLESIGIRVVGSPCLKGPFQPHLNKRWPIIEHCTRKTYVDLYCY
jgi:hypothetical protein